ncbi:hypothetical protein ANTQUA_LOCUS8021 [Anthophora quadrimaculata]
MAEQSGGSLFISCCRSDNRVIQIHPAQFLNERVRYLVCAPLQNSDSEGTYKIFIFLITIVNKSIFTTIISPYFVFYFIQIPSFAVYNEKQRMMKLAVKI